VTAYGAFLSRFEKKPEDGGGQPDRVEEESESAYLTANFHVARAWSRLEDVESLRQSLHAYEYLDSYLRRNRVEGMETEAAVCKEMVELLPRRLAERNSQERAAA